MLIVLFLFNYVNSVRIPESCEFGKYFEPSLLECLPCLANVSLVTSQDGFGCTCAQHTIPAGVDRCRPCNITEIVSTDGSMCVPKRCQSSAGRISCRKCPHDYISVTQNFDGSPMKEVQCIKCARGYKADNNICVKCEACACSKTEIVIKGKCISRKYVLERPKYVENQLHPDELLDIVKIEYLCTQGDIRACRALSANCVRNFYTIDPGGPCRLWIQNMTHFKGLSLLSIEDSKINKPEIFVERGYDKLSLALAAHSESGGFKIIRDTIQKLHDCVPPIDINIGEDILQDCSRNVSEMTHLGDILELYLYTPSDGSLHPIPITLRKPNGYYVQKGSWGSNKFKKFFEIHKYLSTTTNITNIVYLQTLHFQIRVERVSSSLGSLQIRIITEAHYATMSYTTDIITTTLRVEHEMPSAGVLHSLEIWGGVFGCLMVLYALVQWRGVVRRGGLYIALLPLLTSYIADGLYYAMVISVLHALAAEAGTLGLTLPLSHTEEYVMQTLVYAIISLKTLNFLWMNWNQCRCDIFFIDWSKYNPPTADVVSVQEKVNIWKEEMLAREWMSLQTIRRVSPGFTATISILFLQIIDMWKASVTRGQSYKWVIGTIVWWSSYTILLSIGYIMDIFVEPRFKKLPKVCSDLQLSLLVFQEEYYAHYVDGRNEDLMDFRSSTHPLQTCRIICSPQLRTVYQKLIVNGNFNDQNRGLLSKFLGAFFERALDGLNWVANERTILEKLLDVELIPREGGNTSTLLYDTDVNTPSCFAVTWLGEEWLLATFDSMLFGCILITTGNSLIAALVTLFVWQIMKFIRMIFGNWNIKNKLVLRS